MTWPVLYSTHQSYSTRLPMFVIPNRLYRSPKQFSCLKNPSYSMVQLLSVPDNVTSNTTLHNQYHYSPQITHQQLLSWNYDCSVHHVMYDWRLYLVDDDVIHNNVPIPIRMTTWETSICHLLHDMYWCRNIILPWCGDVTWYVACLVLNISYPSHISSWYHRINSRPTSTHPVLTYAGMWFCWSHRSLRLR